METGSLSVLRPQLAARVSVRRVTETGIARVDSGAVAFRMTTVFLEAIARLLVVSTREPVQVGLPVGKRTPTLRFALTNVTIPRVARDTPVLTQTETLEISVGSDLRSSNLSTPRRCALTSALR